MTGLSKGVLRGGHMGVPGSILSVSGDKQPLSRRNRYTNDHISGLSTRCVHSHAHRIRDTACS